MARSFKDILKDLGIGVKSPEQIEREKDPVLAKSFKRQVPTPEDYKISKAYRARKAQEAIQQPIKPTYKQSPTLAYKASFILQPLNPDHWGTRIAIKAFIQHA